MHRIYLAILLPAAAITALPSCEAVPEDESFTFRTDICVLINEPPQDPEDGGDGAPPDLLSYPPCYDPEGCTNPASGYFYYTYFDDVGGFTNVSGGCPPPEPDPKVEADSQAEAEEQCYDDYGDLCRALCQCHGKTAVMEAGQVQTCAAPTNSTTYACGCSCEEPPV